MPSATVLPPPAGRCCHCGQVVPAGQHERAYHVEQSVYVVPVNHCSQCVDNKDCAATCSKKD